MRQIKIYNEKKRQESHDGSKFRQLAQRIGKELAKKPPNVLGVKEKETIELKNLTHLDTRLNGKKFPIKRIWLNLIDEEWRIVVVDKTKKDILYKDGELELLQHQCEKVKQEEKSRARKKAEEILKKYQ